MATQSNFQWSPAAAVPSLFGTRDQWKTFFSVDWRWGDGFGMIQVHDIYCVLYLYFVAIPGYSPLTLGLAFTLLWESDAAVTGAESGGNVSSCKYTWSFSCSLTYLLLWGLVLNRPWTSPGDPCPIGSKLNLLYIEGPSPPKPTDLLQSYLPLHTPKQADLFTCKSLEKSSIFQLLCFR